MPRSTPGLIADTFRLYRRHPLLFLVLAGGVIVPYQLIVLAATGTGQFNRADASPGASFLLSVVELALTGPLVSALHVHAVMAIRDGARPKISRVVRQGLRALPVVAAATIMAFLGTVGAFLLLVVPGIYVYLRWAVAAQAAAIEREGWSQALSRSWALTEKRMRHVAALVVGIGIPTTGAYLLVRIPFAHEGTTALSFLIGLLLNTATQSLTALATALLFFDLRVRRQALAKEQRESSATPAPRGIRREWEG